MKKVFRGSILVVCTTSFLAGCMSDSPDQEIDMSEPTDMAAQSADDTAPSAAIGTDYASVEDVQTLIDARSEEYEALAEVARQQGFVGGALRGAVLALLIDADPALVAAGAIVGGAIGAASGDKAASELILEHKNYLVRRWSLERVIASAKTDSSNTRFDLILSDKLTETAKANPDQTVSEETLAQVETMKSHAVSRALTLREVLPLYEDNATAAAALEAELRTQLAMVAQLDENLEQLEALA